MTPEQYLDWLTDISKSVMSATWDRLIDDLPAGSFSGDALTDIARKSEVDGIAAVAAQVLRDVISLVGHVPVPDGDEGQTLALAIRGWAAAGGIDLSQPA